MSAKCLCQHKENSSSLSKAMNCELIGVVFNVTGESYRQALPIKTQSRMYRCIPVIVLNAYEFRKLKCK